MSGISGMVHWDDQPVEKHLLYQMNESIGHRGPDGFGYWIKGAIGFGHAMLRSTPESVNESQPLVDASEEYCITFDGRLDNRLDLSRQIEAQTDLRTQTDAGLVLNAYKKWGETCFSKLLGDFSFAIWDGNKKQLVCGRDPVGLRPFYYYFDNRRFFFGSELHQIIRIPGLPGDLNEGMIAEYLALAITSQEETLHAHIRRLPPGKFLVVGKSLFRTQQYWDTDNIPKIEHQKDSEYAEEFYSIFEEAVACRLRSQTPVGALLSGGLDSSSIVAVVDVLRRRGVFNQHFETFSLIFPGLLCDESAFIKSVVTKSQWTNIMDAPGEPSFAWYSMNASRLHDFPDYPNGTMHDSQRALARERGIRVMLTGAGGDDWWTGESHGLHAAWGQVKEIFQRLSRILKDRSMIHRNPTAIEVLKALIGPLLPEPAKDVLKTYVLRQNPNNIPQWLKKEFADQVCLDQRISDRRFKILPASVVHSLEIDERSAARFGLEQRHPFHDRRLIEYSFAIPLKQIWKAGTTKYVLRNSMKGLLPKEVNERTDKPGFSHLTAQVLMTREARAILETLPRLSERGWINLAKIQEMYKEMEALYLSHDQSYYRYTWPLWMLLGIELLLASEAGVGVGFRQNNIIVSDLAWMISRRIYAQDNRGGFI